MIYFEDYKERLETKINNECLVQSTPTWKSVFDGTNYCVYIIKLIETYQFSNEEDVNKIIDEAKKSQFFVKAEKKTKKKYNKELDTDVYTYIVSVSFKYDYEGEE